MINLTHFLLFLSTTGAFTFSWNSQASYQNNISGAGGIVSPSGVTALGENPAGLVYNKKTILSTGVTRGTSSSTFGYGGGIFTGNGDVGGGVSLTGFNSHSGSPGNVLLLNYGIGINLSGGDFAFGVTGTTTLLEKGEIEGTGTSTTWCADAGIIINPNGRNQWGISVFQLLADVIAVGVGYGTRVGQNATFVVDTVYTKPSSTYLVKPGIKAHWSSFQLELSYGQRVLGSGWTWISSGPTVGAGLSVGNNLALTGYINHIAKVYVGLEARL